MPRILLYLPAGASTSISRNFMWLYADVDSLGHSMVLDPKLQSLFIFAGQRDERYLADMYAFHIPTNTVTELFSNFTAAGGPDPCFTQRAVIDPEKREIYVYVLLLNINFVRAESKDSGGSQDMWPYPLEAHGHSGPRVRSTILDLPLRATRAARQVDADPPGQGGSPSLPAATIRTPGRLRPQVRQRVYARRERRPRHG